MIYLGNGQVIKQLDTELQRDESLLRFVTTKLLEQSVPEMFVKV
jgi:ribosomal protein S6